MRPRAWLTAAVLALLATTLPATASDHEPAAPPGDAGEVAGVPCWEEEPPCSGSAEPPASEEESGDDEPVRIVRSSGRGRPEAAEMQSWHRDYARRMAPLKRALGRLLAAQPVTRPAHLGPRCRQLAAAVAAVELPALLPAPDLVVDLYLKQALDQLAGAAAACSERSFARTDYHLLQAGRALLQLDLALRPYRLGW